jgi:hypothetical protein
MCADPLLADMDSKSSNKANDDKQWVMVSHLDEPWRASIFRGGEILKRSEWVGK